MSAQTTSTPKIRHIVASAGFAALLLGSSTAFAQTAPNLNTAAPYAVLGTNTAATVATVTCTNSTVNGNVGTTFTSLTNTGCTISGSVDAPVLGSVVSDFNNAYASINDISNPCTGVIPTGTAVVSLPPGVYCSAAGTTLGAGTIITLLGNATDVWVFRVGTGGLGALTLTDAIVTMGGSALACNVYWKTAEAFTSTRTAFVGTVLSGTAVSMTDGNWVGRGMATTDATITRAAPLTFAACGGGAASITVNKDFIPDSTASVSVSLTCTSGTATVSPRNASEAIPAVFTVTGALVGATCTATEAVPAGYTANQANCVGVPLGGACTITNTLGGFIPGGLRQVPTLSEWAMILLAGLMAIAGFAAMRRRGR